MASVDDRVEAWGERLFFPAPKRGKAANEPSIKLPSPVRPKASAVRRFAALFARRAPQVVVKITGGSSSGAAIKAHMNYATKFGERPLETEDGMRHEGKEAIKDVADLWRTSGSEIPWYSDKRREALHVMVSMPRGTATVDQVEKVARRFAREHFKGRHWLMVVHDHQKNPHVHLLVKMEGFDGRRLNPKPPDLQRWRDTTAREFRALGVDAQSTRQAIAGQWGNSSHLWQLVAKKERRLKKERPADKRESAAARSSRVVTAEAWSGLAKVLADSPSAADKQLAEAILARVVANQEKSRMGGQEQAGAKRPPRESDRGL